MRPSHPSTPFRSLLILAALMALTLAAVAQERDRAKIPDKYTWNLADIYPDVAAWRAAKTKIEVELPALRSHQGKLGSSAQALADALDHIYRAEKELSRLYTYASMLADQDTRDSTPQGMQQEMQQLYAAFGAQVSYVEPEILKIGGATIETFISAEPRLKPYAFYLRDVLRRAPHTLTDNEEKMLADVSPLAA